MKSSATWNTGSRVPGSFLSTSASWHSQPRTATYLVPERGVRQKRKWGLFHRRLVTRLLPRLAWLPQPAT